MFENIPNVKLGIIAVSRDCFPRRAFGKAPREHRQGLRGRRV